MRIRTLACGAALAVLAFAACGGAYAQEINGAVAGDVTENGKPVAGAQVDVTNVGTGATISTTSGSDGFYTVRNLPPGGPYTVKVTAPDKTTSTVQVDQIAIGQPYQLDVPLGGEVAAVVVTATARARIAGVQTGPRTLFTAADIQTLPSFQGDLKDLARLNPFVTIDEANSGAMIIAGANNHLNTIYLDGVRQSDDFGLNAGGYPTQRSPFSLDVVRAFNVEIAPYDVQYGNFQGGILNVVTKSGTNQFHGSASYSYDSSSFLSGKVIGADALKTPGDPDRAVTTKFEDQDSSFTIGGPIWPDRLFFFFGYEHYQGVGAATYNPQDAAGANPIPGVTQANVASVLADFGGAGGYNYNPLTYGGTAPIVDTKYFAKWDWYITDKQHLFVNYQNTDGTSYNVPNGSVSNKILNFESNDYIYEQRLTAWTADLVSHWTDQFSTEAEYSYKDVESPSELLSGPFAEFKIQFPSKGSIYLGPDISRQANNLGNIDQQFKFKGHYTLGDHVLTVGYEHESLREFDLFVQNATGVYTFSSACGSGNTLTNLANHVACALTYSNAFDNNPNTAADTATNFTDTLYGEDEWRISPELTVSGGLRFEAYSTRDVPLLNPRFVAQYGYANNGTINGENIIMPRFGFNWRPDPSWTITGGVGLFSGGNPGVYTYNSYDNTGNLVGSHTYTCTTANCATDPKALTGAGTSALVGVTGSSIPLAVQQDITTSANLGTGTANALDPHFKPPSTWKASLSVVKTADFKQLGSFFGDGWRFHGDLLYSKVQEAVLWKDIWEMQYQLNATTAPLIGLSAAVAPGGLAPDGRPLFNPNRYVSDPFNPNRTSGQDILLTNTNQGDAAVWAFGLGKTWPFGLDIDYTYTGQRVRDVNPATSSVATSNYNNNITADPNNPGLATSNYQIAYEHRISIGFEHNFIGDYRTALRLFLIDRAGLPFSYAFCTTSSSSCVSSSSNAGYDQLYGQASTSTTHQLLYVPAVDSTGNVTATSDPKVKFAPGFDLAGFNAFLKSTGLIKYAGEISPRNAFKSDDVLSADLHFSQEFPASIPGGGKGEFFLDILDLPNLINKSWGIDNQVSFPYVYAPVVAYNCQFSGLSFGGKAMPSCGAAGQGNFYQFQSFRPPIDTTKSPPANQFTTVQTLAAPPIPTWVIKIGIRYKF